MQLRFVVKQSRWPWIIGIWYHIGKSRQSIEILTYIMDVLHMFATAKTGDSHMNRLQSIQCLIVSGLGGTVIVGGRCNTRIRAGQDQGGPRWDTLTKKSKSTKLLHIVLCYTQGVVAYDLVLFWGCIPPPLTPLQVKPEALILISIGGRTLQCGVVYMFYALVLPKLTFINNCGIGKSKGL